MNNRLTLVRTAIIKKSTNKNAGQGVQKRKPSYTAAGNVTGAATMENSM